MDLFQTSGFTSSALLASVSANVQEVLANIAPIIELIIGVVLAFVLARYLISLFKGTGSISETSTKEDYDAYGNDDSKYLTQEEISEQFPLMRK
jgi:NADH:ubiquinone oxidoreductase subunit 5 (subunit L)/multisubunit Na+/H+ antiporter MnhA subunit